jgi:hypothetical protein
MVVEDGVDHIMQELGIDAMLSGRAISAPADHILILWYLLYKMFLVGLPKVAHVHAVEPSNPSDLHIYFYISNFSKSVS